MASSADAALQHLIQQEGRIPAARVQQARGAAAAAGISLDEALSQRGDVSSSELRGLLRKREALGRACVICNAITYLLPGQSATRASCEVCGGRLRPGSTRRLTRKDFDRRRLLAAAEAAEREEAGRRGPEARRSQRLTRRRTSEAPPAPRAQRRPPDAGRARTQPPPQRGRPEAGPRVSQRMTRPVGKAPRPPAPGPRATARQRAPAPARPAPAQRPTVQRPTVQRPTVQRPAQPLRQEQRGPEVVPPRAAPAGPLPVDVARKVKEAFDGSKQELLARVRREAHEEVQRSLQVLSKDVEARLGRLPEVVAAALEEGPAADALRARVAEHEPRPVDLDPELVAAALSAAAPRELEGVALGLLGSEALRAPLEALDERIEAQQRALSEAAAEQTQAPPAAGADQLAEISERVAALSREQRAVAETLRAEAEAHARDAAREALSRLHPRGVAGLVEEAVARSEQEREELARRLSTSTRRLDAIERRLEANAAQSIPSARRWLALQRALRPALVLAILLTIPVLVFMAFAPAVHEARVNLGVIEGEFRGPHDHLLALAGDPAVLSQVADASDMNGERGLWELLLGVEEEPAARLGARIASVRGSQADYLIVHARGVSRQQALAAGEALAKQVIARAAQDEDALSVLGHSEARRLRSLLWALPGAVVALGLLSLLICWARELRRRGFTDGPEASALLDLPVLLTLEAEQR